MLKALISADLNKGQAPYGQIVSPSNRSAIAHADERVICCYTVFCDHGRQITILYKYSRLTDCIQTAALCCCLTPLQEKIKKLFLCCVHLNSFHVSTTTLVSAMGSYD